MLPNMDQTGNQTKNKKLPRENWKWKDNPKTLWDEAKAFIKWNL